MTTYRERREARADRLRGWADGNEAKGTARIETAAQRADAIPFGQPILVGHYSEGRDRRYRARIESGFSAGYEQLRKADAQRSRAANIDAAAERAIYSDDHDAVEKLERRIAELEAERVRIKAYNASCRKGARDGELLDAAQRANLVTVARVAPYQIGKKGEYPGYALANLSGNISKQRKRLEQLKAAA